MPTSSSPPVRDLPGSLTPSPSSHYLIATMASESAVGLYGAYARCVAGYVRPLNKIIVRSASLDYPIESVARCKSGLCSYGQKCWCTRSIIISEKSCPEVKLLIGQGCDCGRSARKLRQARDDGREGKVDDSAGLNICGACHHCGAYRRCQAGRCAELSVDDSTCFRCSRRRTCEA
jgi:hypothetical protein